MSMDLYIHVQAATHFLSWELPYFRSYFNLVDTPNAESVLFAFGPDALVSGALLPARSRVVLLFPGFGYNPYHDVVHRYGMRKILDDYYDLAFTNPGPIYEAFKESPKVRLCPFSINTDKINTRRQRKSIDKLLHASSAKYAQKDWTRSRDIMRMTGLRYEVFPSREFNLAQRISRRLHLYTKRLGRSSSPPTLQNGYDTHDKLIAKYLEYDGFVHVAAEVPPFVDGKYTATLLEAGLTGSILFWHDTLGLGNDFETIFELPLDPIKAASEILEIRQSINVEIHSKRTAEEIYEHFNPQRVMKMRFETMRDILE